MFEMPMKPLFASHEKKGENIARKRVVMAAHGRTIRAFASRFGQRGAPLSRWSTDSLTWLVNQFDKIIKCWIFFIGVIQSFDRSTCPSSKPEGKLEFRRIEAGKFPVNY